MLASHANRLKGTVSSEMVSRAGLAAAIAAMLVVAPLASAQSNMCPADPFSCDIKTAASACRALVPGLAPSLTLRLASPSGPGDVHVRKDDLGAR